MTWFSRVIFISSRLRASLFKLFLKPRAVALGLTPCSLISWFCWVEIVGPPPPPCIVLRWAFAWEMPFGFCKMFVIFSSKILFSLSISVYRSKVDREKEVQSLFVRYKRKDKKQSKYEIMAAKCKVIALTFEHLVLFGLGLEMGKLSRLFHIEWGLDRLQLLQVDLVLFFLPLGREQFACLRLSPVHLFSCYSFVKIIEDCRCAIY